MSTSTTTAPTLTREQVANLLVQPLEAASVVMAAGPTVFDSSEPLRIPTLTAGTAPGFVGEGELIPTDDVEFDELKLMPSDRKSLKVITRYTAELARQSVMGLDAVLQARLVNDVANKLDSALLTGDGADGSITGIINQPGVQTGTLDVADPDSLLDALALAHAAEVTPSTWIVNAADYIALRKLKGADGRGLVQTDITADAAQRLHGTGVIVTNKLPQGTAVLANMSEVAVVRDTNPTVTVLSERYAEYDEIGLRVTSRFDLGLLRPEGVIVLTAGA
ncbi:phage major capsid protein [Citricoccus zhacaiensis]|uniref:phage major capsid protein n=1 Tax=Citricoccus zhacaiensis TaxID=489142 RepID=UPI0016637E52|nr:phage major capsid protein [Citricoccus zhacaiensis]